MIKFTPEILSLYLYETKYILLLVYELYIFNKIIDIMQKSNERIADYGLFARQGYKNE